MKGHKMDIIQIDFRISSVTTPLPVNCFTGKSHGLGLAARWDFFRRWTAPELCIVPFGRGLLAIPSGRLNEGFRPVERVLSPAGYPQKKVLDGLVLVHGHGRQVVVLEQGYRQLQLLFPFLGMVVKLDGFLDLPQDEVSETLEVSVVLS